MKEERSCDEPMSADYWGAAFCLLPESHDGPHDGGDIEKAIGERYAAQRLMDREERL